MINCKTCSETNNDRYCKYWKEQMNYHAVTHCSGYIYKFKTPVKAVFQEHELRIINRIAPANVNGEISDLKAFEHSLSNEEIKIISQDEIGAEMPTEPKPLGFTTSDGKCCYCGTKVWWSVNSRKGMCETGHPLGRMT